MPVQVESVRAATATVDRLGPSCPRATLQLRAIHLGIADGVRRRTECVACPIWEPLYGTAAPAADTPSSCARGPWVGDGRTAEWEDGRVSDFSDDLFRDGVEPNADNDALGAALGRCAREVADFVDGEGWGQVPQLFALVPTELLAAAEPGLLDDLADGALLTPIQQHSLPEDITGGSPALDEFLATTTWPDGVVGCALVQEIVVLPPTAESALDDALVPLLADRDAADDAARAAAHAHPDRKDGRLIAAVLKDGPSLTLLQLQPDEDADPFAPVELLLYEGLAPGIVAALHATFDLVEDD